MEASHPRFGIALAALDSGDVLGLSTLLSATPDVVHARATSAEPPYEGYFHGATLLHHVAGNPIRGPLPDQIVKVARALLEAGSDPDAPCGGGPAQPKTGGGTTLGLVVTGAQAHIQGHTEALVDLLLDHGATLDRQAGMFGTLYHTVEHQGQREVARILFARGVEADLPTAAGLGYVDLVRTFFAEDGRLLPDADRIWRRTRDDGLAAADDEILADATVAASANGWPDVVTLLRERGAPLDSLRRWGSFYVTPLHAAAWAGWPEVVSTLLELGADPTIEDPKYRGTAADWAFHCGRSEVRRILGSSQWE